MHVGGTLTAGARRSSSKRLNTLEPLGDGKVALPRGQLTGYLEWGPWIGQAGITSDWFYNIDPDSYDTANRLSGRSEEVYFGYNSEYVGVYLGRFNNHWSTHGQIGAFLTDNPRSLINSSFVSEAPLCHSRAFSDDWTIWGATAPTRAHRTARAPSDATSSSIGSTGVQYRGSRSRSWKEKFTTAPPPASRSATSFHSTPFSSKVQTCPV
jgi:hypothetical protein